ncbi:MAG: hypothetical protein LBG75_02835 [Candidatus Nomurabacteria bacterium]|jgi:hypothetical protein|nr:hypothetical protein [Candidatus Nomurabacteria bacterium]
MDDQQESRFNPNQTVVKIDNRKPKNKWKIVAIVFMVLFLAAAGGGVFFLLKSNSSSNELADVKKKNDDNAKTIKELGNKVAELENKSPESPSDATTGADTSKGYLVVKEWGVKLKIPEGMTGVKYQISNQTAMSQYHKDSGYSGTLELSTEWFSGLSGCTAFGPVSLYRYKSDPGQEPGAKNLGLINGYYYTYGGPQNGCGSDESTYAKQVELASTLAKMAETIEKN